MRDLSAAREAGRGFFIVTNERLKQVLSLASDDLANTLQPTLSLSPLAPITRSL